MVAEATSNDGESRLMLKSARASLVENLCSLRGFDKMRVR
jgi:hypothetical protein